MNISRRSLWNSGKMNTSIWRENIKLFRRFLPYLRPWRKYGVAAGILILVMVLLQLPLPFLTRYVIDYVLPHKDIWLLNWIIICLILFIIIRLISSFLSGIFLALFREHTLLHIQLTLFEHIEHLSLSFHNNMKVGYLMSRIGNDTGNLHGLLADTFLNLSRNVLTFSIGVAALLFLHWKLALVSMLTLPCFIYSIHLFSQKLRIKSGEMQENIGKVYDVLGESLSGIFIAKLFCAEKSQAKKLFEKLKVSFHCSIQYSKISLASNCITSFIGAIGPLIILWYGGREIMIGNLSLGSFVAFNAFLGYLYGPIQTIMGLNANIQTAFASLKRIFELFDIPKEDIELTAPVKLDGIKGEVIFQNVSFSYDGSRPVLKDVSFKVLPGEKVALIGRSGAGKSTLVNLIPKFFEPQTGTIYVDRIDIKNIRVKDLRKYIGIVPQATFLFSGSIYDNIKYGKINASNKEIMSAAQVANVDEFARKLPLKYKTEVGERGVKLSGGECQRIAIARAILKDPRILILDEATSEVDSKAEKLIQQALNRLMQGRTTFIIAHRLFTALNSDRIFALENGKIIGEGKHEILYKTLPLYKKLCEEQLVKEKIDEGC